MKKMKRGLALLLSVLMMISLSTVSAFAQDALLVLTVDNESPSVGDTINISFSIENGGDVDAATFFFRFDPEVWEFVSYNDSGETASFGQLQMGTDDTISLGFMCSFSNPPAEIKVGSFTFKVLKTGSAVFEPQINQWFGSNEPQFTELHFKEPTLDWLTYEIVDGKAVVTACSHKASGEVTIPDTYEGYPVTAIGDSAFSAIRNLTGVVIPEGVTTIGDAAFSGCSDLERVTMPSTLTSLGEKAFAACMALTEITIPDGVTRIGKDTFSNCSRLAKVDIPDSVTEIGSHTFFGCKSLRSVTLPKNLTKIADGLFVGCEILSNVKIPDGVTQIGKSAFAGTALLSFVIPKGVTIIENGTFTACESLSKITIPDGVTRIGNEAFYNCSRLMSVTIPASVTEIAYDAFGVGFGFPNGFKIYGTAGTEAERYAKANRVGFISGEKEPPYIPPENEYPGGIIVDDEPYVEMNAVDNKGLTVEAVMAMIEDTDIAVVGKDDQPIPFETLVGTGCKIQMLNPDGIVLSVYTVIVPMDVDGDAVITAQDARLALRAAAQIEALEECYRMAADADGNESLTASDARRILRKAANLE